MSHSFERRLSTVSDVVSASGRAATFKNWFDGGNETVCLYNLAMTFGPLPLTGLALNLAGGKSDQKSGWPHQKIPLRRGKCPAFVVIQRELFRSREWRVSQCVMVEILTVTFGNQRLTVNV